MANRRFEMFVYRQVLTRMRLGDTDRAIARAGLMGRRKAAELRKVAQGAGWLDPALPLPEDAQLSQRLVRRPDKASSVSLAEPFRERITQWWGQGDPGHHDSPRAGAPARLPRLVLLGASIPSGRGGGPPTGDYIRDRLARLCDALVDAFEE